MQLNLAELIPLIPRSLKTVVGQGLLAKNTAVLRRFVAPNIGSIRYLVNALCESRIEEFVMYLECGEKGGIVEFKFLSHLAENIKKVGDIWEENKFTESASE